MDLDMKWVCISMSPELIYHNIKLGDIHTIQYNGWTHMFSPYGKGGVWLGSSMADVRLYFKPLTEIRKEKLLQLKK
jgi:hypothetical protein